MANFIVEYVNWTEIGKLTKILSKKIKWKPDVVIGILRGGKVPAERLFKSCKHDFIGIRSYEKVGKQNKVRIYKKIDLNIKDKKVLVVDDIDDSGETLKVALKYLSKLKPKDVRTAELHHKMSSSFKPDYYAKKIIRWRWITYAWSLREDLSDLIGKFYKKEMDVESVKAEIRKRYKLNVKLSIVKGVLNEKRV